MERNLEESEPPIPAQADKVKTEMRDSGATTYLIFMVIQPLHQKSAQSAPILEPLER